MRPNCELSRSEKMLIEMDLKFRAQPDQGVDPGRIADVVRNLADTRIASCPETGAQDRCSAMQSYRGEYTRLVYAHVRNKLAELALPEAERARGNFNLLKTLSKQLRNEGVISFHSETWWYVHSFNKGCAAQLAEKLNEYFLEIFQDEIDSFQGNKEDFITKIAMPFQDDGMIYIHRPYVHGDEIEFCNDTQGPEGKTSNIICKALTKKYNRLSTVKKKKRRIAT